MSRYDSTQTGGSSDGSNDFEDTTTLKLQQYAAVRLTPQSLSASGHDKYGTSLIQNYGDAAVLDGIVFQRDDKPGTWKVFSADKFFNLNPEDGSVYENYNGEDGYTQKMSAQDIIEHQRVGGFSENFGGTDYFYTLVGAVIEADDDLALTGDVDVEADNNEIVVGDASILSGNQTWVRTYAKKLSESGPDVIADNGENPTGETNTNPKYSDHDWLAPEEPSLRSDLEGRALELWITETTTTMDDGEEVTYSVPNVEDVKTGEAVTIDNGDDTESDSTGADTDKGVAADGGSATVDEGTTGGTESPDEPTVDDGSLPADVPDALDDLLDFIARNNDESTADDIRAMAENEVESPGDVDWEAAATVANERAE